MIKGEYIIIGKFKGADIKKKVSLLIRIYSQENLFFEFIKNIKADETIIDYKYIFNYEPYQTLKRVKYIYKNCEDLREKFLYHKTLIKFLKEKLGCEFTLSGLGFYIDSFHNNKVDCIIRVDKTKTAKFKQIIVSQKIEKSNKPSNIYVGESHINGEIIGRGEIWELKETLKDENYEKPLETKLIFRGEIMENKQVKASEIIQDNQTSEFKETYNYDNSGQNNGHQNFKRRISKVDIFERDDDEISVHSELEITNKNNWKINTPLHPYSNHNLFLCETERFFGDGYLCNRCRKEFKNTIPSYYCTRCDFDICDNCIKEKIMEENSKIGEYDNEGDFWQFKSQYHIHPLTYLTLKNDLLWTCDKCKLEIDNDDFFYFCSECEYYLCEDCKQKEKIGNPYQLLSLWHEHHLSFCFPIRGSPAYNCDHCGKLQY